MSDITLASTKFKEKSKKERKKNGENTKAKLEQIVMYTSERLRV